MPGAPLRPRPASATAANDECGERHTRNGRHRNHGHRPRGHGGEEGHDEEGEDQRYQRQQKALGCPATTTAQK